MPKMNPQAASEEDFRLRLRRWADAKALPPIHVEKWLALREPGRTRLLETAETLKMHAGQCIAALDLLDEIAVREGRAIDEILDRPALRRIVTSGGSGPGRARALLDELRTARYPRLAHAAEQLAKEVAALKLPPGIKVILPRELGSDEIRVQIISHGSAQMKELLAYLAAKGGALVRLAAMLAGSDGRLFEPE